MSGIAGYLAAEPVEVRQTVLHRMVRQLEHRGRDGEDVVIHDRFGLGYRRGPAGACQPVASADGRHLLVCDGELYNAREVRGVLAGAGHRFSTDSDAEVLLAAWRQWGAAGFDQCEGGFAVAVLDTDTNQVTLARDPFGTRPLYVTTDGCGRVAFASELRAVLAAGVAPRRPDDVTVYRYLRFRVHDDTERTFFDRVSRLTPGQLAVITPDGRINRRTYTRLYYELDWLASTPQPYDRTAREQVRATLEASVDRRLAGPAPVGAALTGGLDAAVMVATAQRLVTGGRPAGGGGHPPLPAFSVRFDEDRHQRAYLDALTATYGDRLSVQTVLTDPARFLVDLPDFIRSQEEPVLSVSVYGQYRLLHQAGQRAGALLHPLGADEALAGYAPHLPVRLRQIRRERGRRPAAAEFLRAVDQLVGVRRAAPTRHGRAQVPVVSLLAPEFVAGHADQWRHETTDHLPRRLAEDAFRDTLPALLRYADRNGARFGVEHRTPYLDRNLVRLLWSLDPSALVAGGWQKRVLRDVGTDLVAPLLDPPRPVPGLHGPEGWFLRARRYVDDVFCSRSFAERPYFHQFAVTSAFRACLAGSSRAEPMLFWRLLNVELWLREMIDRDPTLPPTRALTHQVTAGAEGWTPPLPASRVPRRDTAGVPVEAGPRPAGRTAPPGGDG